MWYTTTPLNTSILLTLSLVEECTGGAVADLVKRCYCDLDWYPHEHK